MFRFLLCFAIALSFSYPCHSQIVADSPHVKLSLPGWCGSGTIAGVEPNSCLITTNAHVTGTTIGRQINIDLISSGRTQRVTGRVIAAFFRSGSTIDFAVVRVDYVTTQKPIPILTDEPSTASGRVIGSPRCVWPLTDVQWQFVRRAGAILYGRPASIGGQSGSAVTDGKAQLGIVTWTDNVHSLAQSGRSIWNAIGGGSIQRTPASFLEAIGSMDRNSRPETEDCFRWQTNSDVRDLPIWSHNSKPVDPPQGQCTILTPAEIDLINTIRDVGKTNKSIDWPVLIRYLAESLR